jgi:murein DD-endopeptidase MepM/ murein hydrolase activator NlpD
MAVFFLAILTAAGISGFFIPFSNFSLDVVERNQRKNLTGQNRKLQQRVHGIRKMLHQLDTRLGVLKEQKKSVEEIAGISLVRAREPARPISVDIKRIDRLQEYVTGTEKIYLWFAEMEAKGQSVFSSVPAANPVAGISVITAGYGDMRDPFTGETRFHYGMDFAAKHETPVVAAADGIVVLVESHVRWGRRIRLRHAHGFSTVYAHLGTVSVVRGQRVARGDRIATVGISGITTGPHLHYEIWLRDKPVDPQEYLFPDTDVATAAATDGSS